MGTTNGPGGYNKHDSREGTGASHREQREAWHDSRDTFRRDYGNLDRDENPEGYEDAFGPVAGQNEDRDW